MMIQLRYYQKGFFFLANMDIHMKFSCKLISKKNLQYLSIDKMKLSFKYGKAYISFTNLFGGNKELGKQTRRNFT